MAFAVCGIAILASYDGSVFRSCGHHVMMQHGISELRYCGNPTKSWRRCAPQGWRVHTDSSFGRKRPSCAEN
jgi:hypothetical protein